MVDVSPWVEIVGLLAGGGGLGVVGTYLGIRKKTQSDLEIAYMNQLNKAFERIEKLEKSQDSAWNRLQEAVDAEREACDERIEKLEAAHKERFDELEATFQKQITSLRSDLSEVEVEVG